MENGGLWGARYTVGQAGHDIAVWGECSACEVNDDEGGNSKGLAAYSDGESMQVIAQRKVLGHQAVMELSRKVM